MIFAYVCCKRCNYYSNIRNYDNKVQAITLLFFLKSDNFMESTVNQRIKILVDALENGRASRFARNVGVSSSVIAAYLPGGERISEPSFTVLQKIAIAYASVNLDWLITGEGEPFKNGRTNEEKMPYMSASHSQQNTNYNTANGNVVNGPAPGNPELEYLRERVRELEKQNTDLLTRLLGLIKK
jgi:transcriptional regulator with XRE-family HTH domain